MCFYYQGSAVIKQVIWNYFENLHTKNCENVDEKDKLLLKKSQLTKIDTRRNRKLEYTRNYFENWVHNWKPSHKEKSGPDDFTG